MVEMAKVDMLGCCTVRSSQHNPTKIYHRISKQAEEMMKNDETLEHSTVWTKAYYGKRKEKLKNKPLTHKQISPSTHCSGQKKKKDPGCLTQNAK